MCPEELIERYRDLQHYLRWSTGDRDRVVGLAPLMEPHLDTFVEDFYHEVQQHPETRRVLKGGPQQVERLKVSLRNWLQQLFAGQYDADYVQGRWQVGLRHAEIGLHQVYTNMALSRLRSGMHQVMQRTGWPPNEIWPAIDSLNKLLDLDLAIIEDSYEFHRLQLEKRLERERSERKFRNLVEAAACMIVIMRDDMSVLYFSPFAERLTGYSASEVEQKSFLDLIDKTDGTSPTDPQPLTPNPRLPITDIDMPIRCRDGSQRWLVWNAIRLEDFDGTPAVIAVGHDITEKRRSAEKLLQSERLAAIGQTITGLAHESRNAVHAH